MLLDIRARFADAQETTVSAASTDVIDTVAAGDSYEGAWFVSRIDTATTSGGSATVTFQLQTAATEDFTGDTAATLIASTAFPVADLTAGKYYAARIPPGAKRYLRAYQVIATADLTAGKFDHFITNDIDVEINKRKLLNGA